MVLAVGASIPAPTGEETGRSLSGLLHGFPVLANRFRIDAGFGAGELNRRANTSRLIENRCSHTRRIRQAFAKRRCEALPTVSAISCATQPPFEQRRQSMRFASSLWEDSSIDGVGLEGRQSPFGSAL